ncbi:hypothetical protein HHI36_013947 [Cryptolaemus montrouzieri]|uniref:tRNA-splicing endonuclease subunit Sen54 N-terminal domain-containing protein n=1 Tax=Cryptolaemus montrouzieri TaxID=559131 RepID=A0ABD2N1X7_9CUCU
MDIKELAAKYIKCHNNPLNKIDLPTSKLFLEDPKDQKLNKEKYQNILKDTLDYVRVDRRCTRSKGEWIEDLNLCKVSKLVGSLLKNFGFQDKTGIYFLPEEALFLMEHNKLEMTYKEKPISLCGAYNILLKTCSLRKYRVYKKLVGQGFKLLNKKAIRKFYCQTKKKSDNRNLVAQKRKNDSETSEHVRSAKIQKINVLSKSSCNKKDNEKIYNVQSNSCNLSTKIFDRLRETAPKLLIPEHSSKPPDYFGFLPSSMSKHKHEFNLYVREELRPNDFNNLTDVPNVIALCTNDNIAFYRFPNVNIPIMN